MSAALVMPDLSVALAKMPLEWRLCDRDAFGLTTASPLQRAICRIADGKSLRELASDPTVRAAIGAELDPKAAHRPRELAILSGIRVGKSLMAAAMAVHWSQTCDVSKLGPGEIPRVSIVSLTKDLSDVVFGHIVGRLQQSPIFRTLVLGEPGGDCVVVRHPTGRPIEIKVVAGSRAGASLVARWSAGCIFDEFPRMVGGSEGVVNWDDSRNAVLLRLLPGSQLVHIGSPWAPFGPAYDLVTKHWGNPSASMLVVKAPAPAMNPFYWTPERVEESKSDPDVYRTDVMAEFSTPEESLYSAESVARAIRPEVGPEAGHIYTAAMDPATRGNSWTFGVFTRTGKQKRMVLARQQTGSRSEPLSPRVVFRDTIAPECKRFGITSIETDQYYVDALTDIAREFGISLIQHQLTEREKTERYLAIRAKLDEGEIELPAEVRTDMLRARKRVTQNGVQIVLPLTSDGRHADYCPTIMLGIGRYLRDVEPEVTKKDPEAERMLKATLARFGPRKGW
jgi:hypothetical protein